MGDQGDRAIVRPLTPLPTSQPRLADRDPPAPCGASAGNVPSQAAGRRPLHRSSRRTVPHSAG